MCPKKEQCKRFTEPKSFMMQSYYQISPYRGDFCREFVPNDVKAPEAPKVEKEKRTYTRKPKAEVKPRQKRKK